MSTCGPRMLYTCATAGCSEAGRGFTDEPTFCAICLLDLAGVFDATGTLHTDDERRATCAPERPATQRDRIARKRAAARREQIAAMFYDGRSNREIATQLGTSPGTVEVAIARMRRAGWDLPYRPGYGAKGRATTP